MKKSQLIELAAEELYRIKRYAKKKEFKRLINERHRLDGGNTHLCVYGLLTGGCFSNRAAQLTKKCATNFFSGLISPIPALGPKIDLINGSLMSQTRNLSDLEIALYHYPRNIESLIEELAEAEFPTA